MFASGATITLRFPVDQPVLRTVPPDLQPIAAPPTLVPSAPLPLEPPENDPAEPNEPRRSSRRTILMVTGAVATAFALVAVTLAVREPAGVQAGPGNGGRIDSSTESSTALPDVPVVPASNAAPVDDDSARRLLESQVAKDRPNVEAFVGYWVPQLSSKRPGLVANGITFDHRAIWADFTTSQAQHPGVLLVWSGDYSSFKLANFWVTVAPQYFDSGEAANDWCVGAGIGRDDCYAKRIMHTGGYTETTLLRK